MKLYHVYKQQFNIVIVGLFLLFPFVFSYAQNASDVSTKITQRNNDIAQLELEIKQYQNQLDGLGKQKNSLNVSIQELDINRKRLVANINLTQKKIDKTNLKIQNLSSDIHTKESSISTNKKAIMLTIKQTDQFEKDSLVEDVLSQKDFSLIWNDIDNMATLQNTLKNRILELKKIKGALEDTRQESLDAKKELVFLKSELSDQKKIVDQNTLEKKKLLAQTKNSESAYQKLLADRLAKKDAFEKELRDYESQLKYILDPSKLPNGGVLSWPLDYVYITQLFGKTVSSKRLYASGSHSGVDFRAPVGTPVKSMADGIIAGRGDTDIQCSGVSYGKFILIKYNNGLASTYGHLSLIKSNVGDVVSRGEIIGYSGNTGYSTGPHLHVSVYPRDAVEVQSLPSKSCPGRILTQPIAPVNAYLDPSYYLPVYKK